MLHISELDRFKTFGVNPGYESNTRRFYPPWDDAHPVIITLLQEARTSLVGSQYAFTDVDAAAEVDRCLKDPAIYTQLTLDQSEFGGATEAQVLAQCRNDDTGNSIAIGHSERGAIIHRKMWIINGIWLVTGSTNLSLSGEQRQDNELTVTHNAVACAEARHMLDLSHTKALKDMAGKAGS